MNDSLWGWKKDDMFWHWPELSRRDRPGRPAIVTGFAARAIYYSYLDENPMRKYSLNNPTRMRRMTMQEYMDAST